MIGIRGIIKELGDTSLGIYASVVIIQLILIVYKFILIGIRDYKDLARTYNLNAPMTHLSRIIRLFVEYVGNVTIENKSTKRESV